MLRAQTLIVSFLWSDLGWLELRLCPQNGTWTIHAHANSGPWTGAWTIATHPDRASGAAWMAALEPDDARAVLLAHPPFAAAAA